LNKAEARARMTAFAGNAGINGFCCLVNLFIIEFGVMPEIVRAIEDMDWL